MEPAPQLRVWPAVVAVALQFLLRFGLPALVPDSTPYAVGAGLLGGAVVLVWWLFFSRAPQAERWTIAVLIVAAFLLTPRILHPSVATGMMGLMFTIYAIPAISLALAASAAAARRWKSAPRFAAIAAAILLANGMWALVRTEGITGDGHSQFAWRWSASFEQQLLSAQTEAPPAPLEIRRDPLPEPPAAPAEPTPPPPLPAAVPDESAAPEWPGFRGPSRDSRVPGLRIATSWTASPPVELWRRAAGPGWSSFAIGHGRACTQEQRGEFEAVSCYGLLDGKLLWTHRTAARFWESNAGTGPRGTPTLAHGRLYALGATGILNALDAASGAIAWSRDVAADTGAKLPEWGFSASPVVAAGAVIVAASGRLAAYDAATGEPRWFGPALKGSYSSPHLLLAGGAPQIALLTNTGLSAFDPASGEPLWQHDWPGDAILQPAALSGSDLLVATGGAAGGAGTRRLSIHRAAEGWSASEIWTSRGLKPYFNDFVVNNGHAYGFDGAILSCINLDDGKRKWKGGRYGHGQMLLLPDQDLLLILSESGELVLVSATPNQFQEIARVPALEGKTWNHPAIAGNILLVRNAQEMAAFRLPPAEK
ncbi:MAG: PQQ-binding-like beta-propeller repeat protein [Bryobacteraceae bacterium]|nr:PQQ-binding-like beta-propeller repeat protein [Bryobacteraceae bacterium]